MENLLKFVIMVVILLVIMLYGAWAWGVVFDNFWSWFVLPVFPNLPNPTLLESMGLMYFVSLFNIPNLSANVKEEYRDVNTNRLLAILLPWITLGLGYFLHLFIN